MWPAAAAPVRGTHGLQKRGRPPDVLIGREKYPSPRLDRTRGESSRLGRWAARCVRCAGSATICRLGTPGSCLSISSRKCSFVSTHTRSRGTSFSSRATVCWISVPAPRNSSTCFERCLRCAARSGFRVPPPAPARRDDRSSSTQRITAHQQERPLPARLPKRNALRCPGDDPAR